MSYKGKFFPKNIKKYSGSNRDKIIYRSMWENRVFNWCDLNPDVVYWSSEDVIIPYRCKTDGKAHRYFPDLLIKFRTGPTLIVEIKPEKQTSAPDQKKGRGSRKFIKESMTYAKNISKWEAAIEYCNDREWSFQIWTEKTIKNMGIKLLI